MLEELRKQLEARLASVSEEPVAPIHQGRQFLAFRVAEQELLVAVDDVREIIMPPPITFIPRASRELEGVIALRGEILPVVNLRRMLGFAPAQLTATTRILIVRPEQNDFGIIVDEITQFLWLHEEDIGQISQGYLTDEFKVVGGVAKTGATVRPLLDVQLVLAEVFKKGDADENDLNNQAS